MATTQLEKVTVAELTKFGFKNEKGEYVNWSKTLKDDAKIAVVPGRTFQMELYIADSGKKYVNKVLQMVESADVPAMQKQMPISVTKANIKNILKEDAPMQRADWDAKDRRISRQGAIQAAVNAVASYVTEDNHFAVAQELALSMLDFVNAK